MDKLALLYKLRGQVGVDDYDTVLVWVARGNNKDIINLMFNLGAVNCDAALYFLVAEENEDMIRYIADRCRGKLSQPGISDISDLDGYREPNIRALIGNIYES